MDKAKIFKKMDEVFFNIKEGQADTQKKLDALVIPKCIDPMIEVRRLCKEHEEAMKCNILA